MKISFFNRFNHIRPIVVNSIPKSGTNLLLNILLSIPKTYRSSDYSLAGSYKEKDRMQYILGQISDLENGAVISGHVPFFNEYADWLENKNLKQIFIYRDPRDVSVSLYHYIMEKTPKHDYYDMMATLESDENR